MTDERALEAVGLFKRYGDRRAVQGVDLVLRAGEVHGLLGPNGAGKTTLMRMLLGLARPDAGVVRLLGQVGGTPSRALPGGVAGFVDTPSFYPYLSGRKNLTLLARLDGPATRAQVGEKVAGALEQVGLTAHADAKVAGYSAGMRQRLGLAAALLRSPRLLLLDEPTSSLDPAGVRDFSAQVRRLAAAGVAVLLSSHDMAEVEGLCSTLTILHHGRVAFAGTVEELRRQAPPAAHRLRTSDDERALALAAAAPDVQVAVAAEGVGLEVRAGEAALDGYVLALAHAGIATRGLEPRDGSLESMFLRLTTDASAAVPPPSPVPAAPPEATPCAERGRVSPRGVLTAAAVEHAKLKVQFKAWATLAVCLLGPFAFAVAMRVQGSLPEDTLFGRLVKASGFAVPLVVLGFAALWAFPVLTSIVAGDLFAAEDRYGTWPNLLTRARTRGEIFAGKVVAGLTFSLVAVCALAASSIAAGVLVIGRQPLVGLSGTLLSPGATLGLTASAWLSILPPVLAFTMLALVLSAATRSSAAGIGLPVLVAFLMQLSSYVNGPSVIQRLLLTPPFVAWHGLFTEPRYYGPLLQGTATSGVYFAGCLGAAYLLLRRREVGTS